MTRKTIGILGLAEVSKGGAPSQRMADTYAITAARMTGAVPLIIPSLPETQDIGHLLEILDGIVLTGGRANVHPEEYGHAETEAHGPFDRPRDRLALDLVRACVDTAKPLFGICRGFQEMAVAYGATLHPEIRDLPGRMNHRMLQDVPREDRYDVRHAVDLIDGGVFAGIYGATRIEVNTLHGQGIVDVGDRVIIEGRADDGTPEALVIRDAPGFALGVQWHAEHDPAAQPVNAPLWEAFKDAMALQRSGSSAASARAVG
ncbi:MAG: gamma-glutamyl-gamma-aminobutyrate hydrolase family protein [Pseudomonadota bacterium]